MEATSPKHMNPMDDGDCPGLIVRPFIDPDPDEPNEDIPFNAPKPSDTMNTLDDPMDDDCPGLIVLNPFDDDDDLDEPNDNIPFNNNDDGPLSEDENHVWSKAEGPKLIKLPDCPPFQELLRVVNFARSILNRLWNAQEKSELEDVRENVLDWMVKNLYHIKLVKEFKAIVDARVNEGCKQ